MKSFLLWHILHFWTSKLKIIFHVFFFFFFLMLSLSLCTSKSLFAFCCMHGTKSIMWDRKMLDLSAMSWKKIATFFSWSCQSIWLQFIHSLSCHFSALVNNSNSRLSMTYATSILIHSIVEMGKVQIFWYLNENSKNRKKPYVPSEIWNGKRRIANA